MYTHPIYHWPPKRQWTQKPSLAHAWGPFSAYVHFPFCRHLCDFCGYETRLISKASAEAFPERATSEIARRVESDDFGGGRLRAVFFGGGTASLMSETGRGAILSALLQLPSNARPEVTLECEPGTIRRAALRVARMAGVNRISLCAQSFSDKVLRAIGRRHTHAQSMQLLDDCLAAGIDNVHLDLMYGLPEQTEGHWARTLEAASCLPVQHISMYKLYVFKYGPLFRAGTVVRPEREPAGVTERLRAMHAAGNEILTSAGFRQYTLTEYARPGSESEYIASCFDGGDVLPIGPAAFGRCGNEVWENSPYVHTYGDADAEATHARALRMDATEAFKRDVILGLWLLSVRVDEIASTHGVEVGERLLSLIDRLRAEGLIEVRDGALTLEERHRFRAGETMARLADLDAGHWSTGQPRARAGTAEPSSGAERTTTLSTVLRMARRDPALFAALEENPDATLRRLGCTLRERRISELVRAITAEDIPGSEPGANEMTEAWSAVRREHAMRSV
ncbi:MAG: coproporphyrinogen III oxidase family protein [Gemmatimonadetes bacterium]|nr:coproporphyrinogen III oxidase family protein [Gemmatimonadota bacterium]